MSKLNIFILDNVDNIKEELKINKPKRYQELLIFLSNTNKLYEIFMYDNNNKIIINNEDKYKLIKDIIFIKEIIKDDLEESIFSRNYKELSESEQDILDEKYNCKICSIIIKNENPYFCYKCQKIFHEKCLKKWDNECKLQNKILVCPNCRNSLPIEKWIKKLDYEDNRIDNAILLNKINEYKLNDNINNNMNIIKDEIIKNYENYINKTIIIFKDILNKINIIKSNLKMKYNYKLNELINNYDLNINNLHIDDVSNIINEELDNINKKICNNKKNNENKITNENQISNENIINNQNEIINQNEINKENKINLIYYLENNFQYVIYLEINL